MQPAAIPAIRSSPRWLSVRSEEFRRPWAAHEVHRKSHGLLRMKHPLVDELQLSYETFPSPTTPTSLDPTVAHHESVQPGKTAMRDVEGPISG